MDATRLSDFSHSRPQAKQPDRGKDKYSLCLQTVFGGKFGFKGAAKRPPILAMPGFWQLLTLQPLPNLLIYRLLKFSTIWTLIKEVLQFFHVFIPTLGAFSAGHIER